MRYPIKGPGALLALLCLVFAVHGQNLIKNPGFETGGPMDPMGPTPISVADHWEKGCDNPIAVANIPSLRQAGATGSNGLPAGFAPHGGQRVAAFRYDETGGTTLLRDDRIRGELLTPLSAGYYELNLWLAADNSLSNPNSWVDVVLQNSNDPCNDQILLATGLLLDGPISWKNHSLNFTIDPQQANTYDRLVIKQGFLPVFAVNVDVFADDLSLVKIAPDISAVRGPVCSGEALVSVPEGIQDYLIKVKDPAGNVVCTIDATDFPIPASIYPYIFCNLPCGSGTFYQFRIGYIAPDGNLYNETIITELLCTPQVGALGTPSVVCPGDLVTYHAFDPASGNPDPSVTYTWYNDNGPQGTGATLGPQAYDPADGVHYVLASNSDGCEAKAEVDLALGDSCGGISFCFANFTWSGSQNGLGNCEVSFTDASLAGSLISSWIWDFGDQTGWNGPNPPTHIYAGLNGYYACLTITTADGCSSQFCDWVGCIRSNERTSFSQGNKDKSFRLFPNPTRSSLSVSHDYGTEERLYMNIFDLQGRCIFTGVLHGPTTSFDVSNLPAGVFTVEIRSDQKRLGVDKLVINQ